MKVMVICLNILLYIQLGIGFWSVFAQRSQTHFNTTFFMQYVIDRVCLIILYQFLLHLKRVQLMTSPVFKSLKQIADSLRKHKNLEMFFLSINMIAIIVNTIQVILLSTHGYEHETLNYIRISPQIIVFCLNIYTLRFFYQMVIYFLNNIFTLDEQKEPPIVKFKMAVIGVMFITVMSNIQDNLSLAPLIAN